MIDYFDRPKILEDGSVTATLTVSKRIADARIEWAEDRLVDGYGGPGYLYGSFDAIRPGTIIYQMSDGTKLTERTSSEDGADHPWTGDMLTVAEFRFEFPEPEFDPSDPNGIPF